MGAELESFQTVKAYTELSAHTVRGNSCSNSRNNRQLRDPATNLPQAVNHLAARVARQMLLPQVTFDLGRLMTSSELQNLFTPTK